MPYTLLCYLAQNSICLLPKPLTPTPYPMHAIRSRRTPENETRKISARRGIVLAQEFLIIRHAVDALLGEFKCGKENSVDDARSRHGHTETWAS
jgi:hypothetical protein